MWSPIDATKSLDAAGYTLMLTKATGSPLLVNGTFTASTSTVNYSGGTSNGIATTTYYNLTVNTAGTLTGNVTSTNLLTINTGKSLAGATFNLTLTKAGSPLVISGTGVFSANTSTVYYNPTVGGSLTIPTTTFYNLMIGNANNTSTLAGPVTVSST